MLKKNVWIVALLAALAMMFVGCGGDFEPEVDLDDLFINGRDVKLVKIGSNAGNEVEGNKYSLNFTAATGDASSSGFGIKWEDLPEDVSQYKFVEVEMRITAVNSTSAVGFTLKKNSAMGDLAGYGANSFPAYSNNAELALGDKRKDEGSTGQYAMKLFDDGIYFQFNPWMEEQGSGGKPMFGGKLKGKVSFTIEVTEVAFFTGSGDDDGDDGDVTPEELFEAAEGIDLTDLNWDPQGTAGYGSNVSFDTDENMIVCTSGGGWGHFSFDIPADLLPITALDKFIVVNYVALIDGEAKVTPKQPNPAGTGNPVDLSPAMYPSFVQGVEGNIKLPVSSFTDLNDDPILIFQLNSGGDSADWNWTVKITSIEKESYYCCELCDIMWEMMQ